jgi:hypothetical protein
VLVGGNNGVITCLLHDASRDRSYKAHRSSLSNRFYRPERFPPIKVPGRLYDSSQAIPGRDASWSAASLPPQPSLQMFNTLARDPLPLRRSLAFSGADKKIDHKQAYDIHR